MLPHLSKKEAEIIDYLKEGLSNKQIAFRLNITENTVKNHFSHIFDKLGVESRTQLLIKVYKSEIEEYYWPFL